MDTEDLQDIRKRKGCQRCIVPGCENDFYSVKSKNKIIHFHTLPLKRRPVLLRWLSAMKRKKPPANAESRICSEHFVVEDYIEKKSLESGNLVTRRTNKLKPDAVPSVFNFTTFDLCSVQRRERAGKLKLATRTSQQVLKHQLEIIFN